MSKMGCTVDLFLRCFSSLTFYEFMKMEKRKDQGDLIIISHFLMSLLLSCAVLN